MSLSRPERRGGKIRKVKALDTPLRRAASGLGAGALLFAAYPALAKLLTMLVSEPGAAFVDQRFQRLLLPEVSRLGSALALAFLALLFWCGRELLRRRGDPARRTPEQGLALAVLPLAFLLPFWFLPFTYFAVTFAMLCFALAAGRFVSQLRQNPDGGFLDRYCWIVLALFVAGYALWGGLSQLHSHSVLGMQWLDWGHYYESLRNTWHGRFFYLNLSHGCFLGSRFCPSLLILSPVLPFGVPGLFFAGALLVASGALLVYALARHFRARKTEALLFGVWYLFLPGVVNLELPLLDGFHEVFLLLPAVLGAVLAYCKQRYWLAGVLVLFCFGVRETAPFMFFGFGVTLFLTGRKRHGVILAGASLLALLLILGVLMPLARPAEKTVYDHVTFYPHLGNTVPEIALSPILRFKAFWGKLFCEGHSWNYYFALFLPFAFLAAAAPEWLIPMAFDLVMVAEDRRFDSQTLLRHYQCVMLITLVVAALEGFRKLRAGTAPKYVKFFLYPAAERPTNGILAATFTATVGMTLFFTQIPGLPGADPRLETWSDVRGTVREFTELMEPGAQVTAGPRLAGFLVDKYDMYLSSDAAEPLKRYVLVEGFNPDYRQKALRLELMRDPRWTLVKSAYLEDHAVQILLFEHKPRRVALRDGVRMLTEREWRGCGSPIPCRLPQLEMRGRPALTRDGRAFVMIFVRVVEPVACDLGFEVRLSYFDAPDTTAFLPFGNGVLPAEQAPKGSVYTFAVPVAGRLRSCQVNIQPFENTGQEL